MKLNLEISVKFFYALIVMFASFLSIPFCDYFYSNHLVQHIYVSGIIICSLLFIAITIDLLLRYLELKSRFKKEKFFSDVSMKTIEDYETQIKEQSDEIERRKHAFEDAVVEITRLRSENETLTENRNYWKERALHQKHTKKEIDSEWWECLTDEYQYFIKGNKYKKDKTKESSGGLIFLFDGNFKSPFLVEKKYFNPVK